MTKARSSARAHSCSATPLVPAYDRSQIGINRHLDLNTESNQVRNLLATFARWTWLLLGLLCCICVEELHFVIALVLLTACMTWFVAYGQERAKKFLYIIIVTIIVLALLVIYGEYQTNKFVEQQTLHHSNSLVDDQTFVQEAAFMAAKSTEVYEPKFSQAPTNTNLRTIIYSSADGEEVDVYRPPLGSSSMLVGVWRHVGQITKQEVVVAFRGTLPNSLSDWTSDIEQFTGQLSDHYYWSTIIMRQIIKDNPGSKFVITGHSLGGGLALFVALDCHLRAFVFNPAGLSGETIRRFPSPVVTLEDAIRGSQIYSFISRGYVTNIGSTKFYLYDIVSMLSLNNASALFGEKFMISLKSTINPYYLHQSMPISEILAANAVHNSHNVLISIGSVPNASLRGLYEEILRKMGQNTSVRRQEGECS